MKAAFIDRDGTIIKDYEDEKWRTITEPEFIDGSLQALKKIREKGYEIVIVTNQYIINEGIISDVQYKEFTDKLLKMLKNYDIDVLDIFYCPHTKKENCGCMKPKTGLIEMALAKYPDISINESFLIGDSLCDIDLGSRFGIRTFGIGIESELYDYIFVESLCNVLIYI